MLLIHFLKIFNGFKPVAQLTKFDVHNNYCCSDVRCATSVLMPNIFAYFLMTKIEAIVDV